MPHRWISDSSMAKAVSLVANIATALLCLAFGLLFVRNQFSGQTDRPSYQAGERIEVPGIDFGIAERTILLVIKRDCRFCEASMPFFRELSAAKPTSNRLVALTTDSIDDSRTHLESYHVSVDDIVRKDSADIKLGATPIVLVVSRTGVVERTWSGLLYAREEAEVFDVVRASGSGPGQ